MFISDRNMLYSCSSTKIPERDNTVDSPMEPLLVSYLTELFEQAFGWSLKSTAKILIITNYRKLLLIGKSKLDIDLLFQWIPEKNQNLFAPEIFHPGEARPSDS